MASDNVLSSTRFDEETGEVDQTVICLKSTSLTCNDWRTSPTPSHTSVRNGFRVPSSFYESRSKQNAVHVQRELNINGVDLTVLNTQNLSPIALILPTLFLFPAWAAIMCALCEASIHIWSHKR